MTTVAKTVDGEPSAAMITNLSLKARDRTCSILLTNYSSHILINPQVHMSDGYCASPPELTVHQGARAIFAFATESPSGNSADGVLTYDITGNRKMKAEERLAIMFSVPKDYNKRDNFISIGFFNLSQPCDESLYQLMYNTSGTFRREKANGSEISYEGDTYTIRGAMTPLSKAEMKLELWNN